MPKGFETVENDMLHFILKSQWFSHIITFLLADKLFVFINISVCLLRQIFYDVYGDVSSQTHSPQHQAL